MYFTHCFMLSIKKNLSKILQFVFRKKNFLHLAIQSWSEYGTSRVFEWYVILKCKYSKSWSCNTQFQNIYNWKDLSCPVKMHATDEVRMKMLWKLDFRLINFFIISINTIYYRLVVAERSKATCNLLTDCSHQRTLVWIPSRDYDIDPSELEITCGY